LATLSASGSSGFGALSSAWMLQRDGTHSTARQHARPCGLGGTAPQARRSTRAGAKCLPPPTHRTHTHLSSTVRICSAGLHLSLRMSKQMRPSLSMLGWYIFVKNRTCACACVGAGSVCVGAAAGACRACKRAPCKAAACPGPALRRKKAHKRITPPHISPQRSCARRAPLAAPSGSPLAKTTQA
jgi:hypothetical protein